MSKDTAITASGILGNELYQQRARRAFPLLVRQAMTQKSIRYKDLAKELHMPNSRNLNYVLGSIGTSLLELSQEWGEDIRVVLAIEGKLPTTLLSLQNALGVDLLESVGDRWSFSSK
jgi:hypothetical protein